jgi:hypothetical protein
MAFTVLAASSDTNPGSYALAGRYVGGQASAAVGVGLGAKVLNWRWRKKLQPATPGTGNQHRPRSISRSWFPVY